MRAKDHPIPAWGNRTATQQILQKKQQIDVAGTQLQCNVMSFLSLSQLQSLAPSIPQRNKGIGVQMLYLHPPLCQTHFPQTRHSLSSESSTGTRLVGSHPSIWLFWPDTAKAKALNQWRTMKDYEGLLGESLTKSRLHGMYISPNREKHHSITLQLFRPTARAGKLLAEREIYLNHLTASHWICPTFKIEIIWTSARSSTQP